MNTQLILTYLIVAIALVFALKGIYRLFKSTKLGGGCNCNCGCGEKKSRYKKSCF